MIPLDILKFGGTSVGDRQSLDSSVRAVESHLKEGSPCLVVVSAMSGITNLLAESINEPAYKHKRILSDIVNRHLNVIDIGLSAKESGITKTQIESEINSLANALALSRENSVLLPYVSDYIISAGERLIAPIFASLLRNYGYNATYLDANEVFTTDNIYGDATANRNDSLIKMRENVLPLLGDGHIVIIPGFYGATYTTFGRGGSDYSATKAAELLSNILPINAVFLYKADVAGVMSADPKIVGEAARLIPNLSYLEAEALAYSPARILHKRSIEPLKNSNIKLYCRNTMKFEDTGTSIGNSSDVSMANKLKIVTLAPDLIKPNATSLVLIGDILNKDTPKKINDLIRYTLSQHDIHISSDYSLINPAAIAVFVERFPNKIEDVVRITHSMLDDINKYI